MNYFVFEMSTDTLKKINEKKVLLKAEEIALN